MEQQAKINLAMTRIEQKILLHGENPFSSELEILKAIEFKLQDLQHAIKNNFSESGDISLDVAALLAIHSTTFY